METEEIIKRLQGILEKVLAGTDDIGALIYEMAEEPETKPCTNKLPSNNYVNGVPCDGTMVKATESGGTFWKCQKCGFYEAL